MKGYRLGLTGYPVAHSLSPRLHRAALQAVGLSGDYSLYAAPPLPDGAGELDGLLARLRTGELDGLNVTIPHKQAVMERMDSLSPAAQAIGAVNTVYVRDGRLVGENTDAPGFSVAVELFLRDAYGRENAAGFAPGRALILGAGGSARAAAYALLQAGWQVTLAARRVEQAGQVVAKLNGGTAVELSRARIAALARDIDLLVNATPVGMWPRLDASPWPDGLALPPRAAVYDLVYNPAQTALLRAAQAAGLPACNGLGMLVEQAALAFECWTGISPPRQVMRQALAEFDAGSGR